MTTEPGRCSECGRRWDPEAVIAIATPAVPLEAELDDGTVLPVVALAVEAAGNVRALVLDDGLVIEPPASAVVRLARPTNPAPSHPRPGRRLT